MKARKRWLLCVLIPLVLVTLLTGCEELLAEIPFIPRTPAPTEPMQTATSTPAPTPAESSTALPTAAQSNLITLWLPPDFDPENGTPAASLLKQQLDTFAADHPEVTIKVRIKAPNGPGGMLDSLATASLAAPDALPGLLILSRTEFEKAAHQGLLMPIEKGLSGFEPDPVFPFAEEMTTVKGIRYAFPFAGDVLCMAYKPVQVAYPPTRWQELIVPDAKMLAFPASDPQGLLTVLLYMSMGGDFGADETVINLREGSLQDSLKLLSEGANANAFPYWLIDYTDYDQSWTALNESKATYAVIWASQYLAELPENITMTSLPTSDDLTFTLADGWVLAFPQTSTEQFDRYQLLAQYLLDTDFQSTWTEAAGLLPASENALLGWKNIEVSGILTKIGKSALSIPSNYVMSGVSSLFQQATVEMIRKQTTYIESSNKILKALAE